MDVSPHVLLFFLFMLAVVQTTRLDQMRQKRRELLTRRNRRTPAGSLVATGSSTHSHA